MSKTPSIPEQYGVAIERMSTAIMQSSLEDSRKEELLQQLRDEEPTLMSLCEISAACGIGLELSFSKLPEESQVLNYTTGLLKHLVEDGSIIEKNSRWIRWSELLDENKIQTAPGLTLASYCDDDWDEVNNKAVLIEEELDFENFSLCELTDDYAKFVAGGDWQLGSILTMRLADNGKLYFTECIPFKNDDTDPVFIHMDDEDARKILGLVMEEK